MVAGLIQFLLYLAAAAWPLGAYALLPFFPWPILTPVYGLLLLCAIVTLPAAGKLRVPLEFLWPPAVIAGLAGVARITGDPPLPAGAALEALCFFAAIHLVQSRQTVLRCLWLTAAAGSVAAILTGFANAGLLFPTAFDPSPGIQMAFAWDVPGGLLTLLVAAGTGLGLVFQKRLVWPARTVAGAAGFVAGTMFLYTLLPLLAGAGVGETAEFLLDAPAVSRLLMAALALWLAARIAAKLIVRWNEDGAGAAPALLAILVLGVATTAAWTPGTLHGLGFFFGLLARYGMPGDAPAPARPFAKALPALGILALLCGYQLAYGPGGNPADPRDYAQSAVKYYQAGRYDALDQYLDFIDRVAPGEARTHWWRAKSWLAQDAPQAAAAAFARAVEARNPAILPALKPSEIERFLSTLRDHCAALPEGERRFAYERALAATGARADVLATLRLRAADAEPVGEVATAPLASALARLVGYPGIEAELNTWPPGDLAALLRAGGATVSAPPAGFPGRWLPLIAVAESTTPGLTVGLYTGAGAFGKATTHRVPLPEGGWQALRQEGGRWHLPLGGPPAVAQVVFDHTPAIDVGAKKTRQDTPWGRSVRVWIP